MGFNSRKGIELALFAYHPFATVMRNRHDDAHRCGNQLNAFVIFGRFETQANGRLVRLNRNVFTDADRAAIPAMMDPAEFADYVAKHIAPRYPNGTDGIALYEGTVGIEPSFPLPPAHVVCARCGKGWDLATCHEIESDTGTEQLDLGPYVGMALKDAKWTIDRRTDATRAFGYPLAINDVPVTPTHVIAPGDSVCMFATKYFHGPCFKEQAIENAAKERDQTTNDLAAMFSDNGFEDVRVSIIPIPEHLRAWLAEDIGDMAGQIPYYRVETRQGSLGIWVTMFPAIDLHDTGILPKDLGIETDPTDTTTPPCAPLLPNKSQLLLLWQLMTKRQRDTPAASP